MTLNEALAAVVDRLEHCQCQIHNGIIPEPASSELAKMRQILAAHSVGRTAAQQHAAPHSSPPT